MLAAERLARSDVGEMTQNLGRLEIKIHEIADRAGVPPHQQLDLESSLSALPWPGRRRAKLYLEGTQAQARIDGNRALAMAATVILALAQEVWTNPHSSAA